MSVKKRNSTLFLVAAMLSFMIPSAAQTTFQKRFLSIDAEPASVQQTFDGGYVALGFKGNSLQSGIFIIKTDANGDTSWTKIYRATSTTSPTTGFSIEQTADSAYVIGGEICCINNAGSDMFIIRMDVNGDSLWTRVLHNSGTGGALMVRQTPDGGFLVAGDYLNLLVKLSASGSAEWSKSYSPYVGTISDIQVVNGGYVLTGDEMAFMKIDTAGNFLLEKTYSALGYWPYGSALLSTFDGGFIIAGNIQDNSQFMHSYIFLVKTDSIGDTLWTRYYGQNGGNNQLYSIVQTNDGGYVFTGSTRAAFWMDTTIVISDFIVKINSSGDTLWTRTYPNGNFSCRGINKTNDGGLIITGSKLSGGWPYLVLAKTDSLGHTGCGEGSTPISNLPFVTTVSNLITADSSVVITERFPVISIFSGCTADSINCSSVGIPLISSVSESLFEIIPNPASEKFTIRFPSLISKGTVEIYSMLGGNVFIENISDKLETEIELKNVSSGMYLIKVYDGKSAYNSKIVIKN